MWRAHGARGAKHLALLAGVWLKADDLLYRRPRQPLLRARQSLLPSAVVLVACVGIVAQTRWPRALPTGTTSAPTTRPDEPRAVS